MFLCLRLDLDYVPWDSPDAAEFGHGEPAALLRLLDLARSGGFRFHFFASERVLRAFPASADAVLNEGHDLDWLCKHPEDPARKQAALELFGRIGHGAEGLALKRGWPSDADPGLLDGFRFLSVGIDPDAPPPSADALKVFPVESRAIREAYRAGASLRSWTDSVKLQLRDHASRNQGLTVVARPQVLAKFDPHLSHVREILMLAEAAGMEVKTLRQLL